VLLLFVDHVPTNSSIVCAVAMLAPAIRRAALRIGRILEAYDKVIGKCRMLLDLKAERVMLRAVLVFVFADGWRMGIEDRDGIDARDGKSRH
jgi:hypothetical protein